MEKISCLSIIEEAIENVDPVNGLNFLDFYRYARDIVDWNPARLKTRIRTALKRGLSNGELAKFDRYRYGLRRQLINDGSDGPVAGGGGGILRICGLCGGRFPQRRRRRGERRRQVVEDERGPREAESLDTTKKDPETQPV